MVLRTRVLKSWSECSHLKDDWARLLQLSKLDHPFMTWEWIDQWYRSFCSDQDVRVVVAEDERGIRAIFPARREIITRKGVRLRSLTAAANGHSPRFAVLTCGSDATATVATLEFALEGGCGETYDVVVLPVLPNPSETLHAIRDFAGTRIMPHLEHAYESPAFNVQYGWGKYVASRSKNLQKRFRQAMNRASRAGNLALEMLSLPADNQTVRRLERLDAQTWQFKEQTGLFSTSCNKNFYALHVTNRPLEYQNFLGILTLDGQDIAYELGCIFEGKAFALKTGYDSRFHELRAGMLVRYMVFEHLAGLGLEEIDLVGEATEEKRKWATHYRRHENWWLLNRRSLAGAVAISGLKIQKLLKRLSGK